MNKRGCHRAGFQTKRRACVSCFDYLSLGVEEGTGGGAGGIKALVQDPEQLRRAVEFGTACGAYVTQVPHLSGLHLPL